jgi:enoyl-CoA hydratase/carnithine racemase
MGLVRAQIQGDTAVVAFARPPVNAFNLARMQELQEQLETLAADVPRGGVVLSGDGEAFSAGVDPLLQAEPSV